MSTLLFLSTLAGLWLRQRLRSTQTRCALERAAQARKILHVILIVPVLLLAGCASQRPHLDEKLMSKPGGVTRNQGVADQYAIGCPDVLELSIAGAPNLSEHYQVSADGRITLGSLGRLRVEGMTVQQAAYKVADRVGLPEGQVTLRVERFQSQQVYLVGNGIGLQRAVPYQGPETVLDLLQRVGGITPGAAPSDVYVIRANRDQPNQPAIFHIDLRAIVLHNDQQTNLRLRPFDQIYVGETRQSALLRCLPPCFKPSYEALCGMARQRLPAFLGGAPNRDPGQELVH